MKLDIKDNEMVVYLKDEEIKNIDFKDINKLEDYFRNLFIKLKKILKQDISGFYIINIYLDDYYGAVLEINKEESDYIFYLDNQIEMKINIIETDFLYETEDIFNNKCEYYLYKNKIYLKLKEKLDLKQMLYLIEHSKIIYDTENILLSSKKIL